MPVRVHKDPEVRRGEILDAAQRLFTTKGYAKTTVMDILAANAIAKGTFYYYFKSKEEVMDAVIARMVEGELAQAMRIAGDPALEPADKLARILLAQRPARGADKEQVLEEIHSTDNAEMHQKSLAAGVRALAPVLGGVVEEGVRAGVFATRHPRQTMELLLAGGQLLFDAALFAWTDGELEARAAAFQHNAELLLGAQPGSLDFLKELLEETAHPPATGGEERSGDNG